MSTLHQILLLNLKSLGQKRIKAQNQLIIPPKQLADPPNDAGRINFVCLEVFHNFEEFVVDAWSVAEFQFDLVEVAQGIFYAEFTDADHGRRAGRGWA